MQANLGTIMCKFGGDLVMFAVEAICAKVYRRTDRRTTDASRLHKLMEYELKCITRTLKIVSGENDSEQL